MALIKDELKQTANRRSFLKGAGVSGLAVASTAVFGASKAVAQTSNTTLTAQDVEVLNFALNLEYLEAEFYTMSYFGQTLEEYGVPITGTGKAGPTTGGTKVDFTTQNIRGNEKTEYSKKLQAIALQITKDEQFHVRLLRQLLGDQAIAKPAINLDAAGFGFATYSEYIDLGRRFEDTGVSAYGGAATLLSTLALGYAARILPVEAYHASALRLLCSENDVFSNHTDNQDAPPPPFGDQYFTTYRSLAVVRTTSEVLAIVYANDAKGTDKGGFFPDGVNGAITTV